MVEAGAADDDVIALTADQPVVAGPVEGESGRAAGGCGGVDDVIAAAPMTCNWSVASAWKMVMLAELPPTRMPTPVLMSMK